jgi:hypothetical protein
MGFDSVARHLQRQVKATVGFAIVVSNFGRDVHGGIHDAEVAQRRR